MAYGMRRLLAPCKTLASKSQQAQHFASHPGEFSPLLAAVEPGVC